MEDLSDGAIAHSCTPKAVGRLVREVGLFSGEVVPYGPFRAKVSTEARKRLKLQRDGRYVVVTGVARQGAGSRIVSIGLTDALAAHLHVNSVGCLTHRTGGVFGGGYSQVFPMDEVSAMLDSDFYAVTTASRLIDTALRERLEPSTEHTLEKQLSSDILSVLAVSQSQQDLSNRLAKLVVATGPDNTPVTTNDLGISRVLAALLRDTLKPTLKQTLEGSPVLVHTNPLSGSSRCDSPVMADHIALKLVGPEGIVVTETGSIDNFVHMKCRRAGLQPDVVVMVATVAGIRKLGGKAKLKKKIWLPDYRISPKFDSKALQEGCRRLNTLIQRATLFGLPVVFAVNVFSSDTTEDIELLCSQAELGGAVEAVPCSSWSLGGAGAVQLGRAVQRATQSKHKVNFLYDMEMSIEEKIRSVAHSMYGAAEVKLLPQAQRKVALFTQQGLSGLPVSLSPSQHDVPVREGLLTIQDLRANTGARFLSALYDTFPPSTLTLTQTPSPCLYDIDLYPENQ